MRMQSKAVAAGVGAAGAIVLSLGVATPSAFADAGLGPAKNDVVGVGSDTVQDAIDFLADGDYVFDAGYNTAGNKYRLINFDATADANVRLSYGPDGAKGTGQNTVTPGCAPGTGGAKGTGNATAPDTASADFPCVQNPTIVLRQGLNPLQRPNGSGAGAAALNADNSNHYIDFSRASAAQKSKFTNFTADSIQIGTDPLWMLKANTSNAVPLSAAQLNKIYSCTNGGTSATDYTHWNTTAVGGSSTDSIIPILPQVGSGTRSSFLAAISNPTLGSCVQTGEENDPTAIAAQASPADAIEPMSQSRLFLFQGKDSTGTVIGTGYFRDPSCPTEQTPSGCTSPPAAINPAVTLISTGSPSDGQALFGLSRPLYIYFRDSDVGTTQGANGWQPGSTLNKVRTLWYNPCSTGFTGCTTDPVAGNVGPGGAPYVATDAGRALISSAGIIPAYAFTAGGA